MASETFDQKEKISLKVSEETSSELPEVVEKGESPGSSLEGNVNTNAGSTNVGSATDFEPKNASPAESASPLPDFGERFETLELIGEGGMGIVYKVRDPALDKCFAVKILRANLAKDKQALKRFQREADALIKLNHPGLVAVYEQGVLGDGTPYIVMDFVAGENLADVLRSNGPMDAQRAARIFDQVMEAIEHVHHSSLVHRDVKSRNIILGKTEHGDDQIKLVDFGIAKEAGLDDGTVAGVTQTGDFLGSPFYMSPEQCQGAEPEHRSDIYSAGCVLYEMLTAKTPFASPNPVKVVVGHLSEKPVAPSAMLSEKSTLITELDFIVLKCLEKSPDRRYQSAASIREDLAACLENRSPHKDRQASKRQRTAVTLLVAMLAIFVGSTAAISGAPLSFSWYAADFLTPHAPVIFGGSLVLFIAFSLWLAQARKSSSLSSKILMAPWVMSYLSMFVSFSLLPRVPVEPAFLYPYFAGLTGAAVASVVFGLKYLALPKQVFFAPKLEASGRVLTAQESKQLSVWRSAIVSIFAAGALLFKAPEFLPVTQAGPTLGSLLLMLILLFFMHKVQLRLARTELTKPGDRWLMFAAIAGSIAAFGHALDGIVNYLAESFLVTVAVSNAMGVLTSIFTFAPLLVAIVFLSVWWTRRQSITPFGKSDGW